jgi:TPR repeat protein
MVRRAMERPPTHADIVAMTPQEITAILDGDPARAFAWLAAAARLGFVDAQLAYAQCLLSGRGCAPDPQAAYRWFDTAARAGSAEGLNMLGRCHENGWGTPRDDALAAPLYRQAAESGLDWAQYNYANMLARGAGVAKDLEQALHWYRLAAAQGHAKATNLVARFLEEGWACTPDPEAAAALYARAAEGGDFRAQFNHGLTLARAGDIAGAQHWFAKAIAGGTSGFLISAARALASFPQPELRGLAALARDRANQAA